MNEFDGEGGLRFGNGLVGEGNFWWIKEVFVELMRERDLRRVIEDNVWLIKWEVNVWVGCWVVMIIRVFFEDCVLLLVGWKMGKNMIMCEI